MHAEPVLPSAPWPVPRRPWLVTVLAAALVGTSFGLQRVLLRYVRDQPLELVPTIGVQLVPWLGWAVLFPLSWWLVQRWPVDGDRLWSAVWRHVATGIGVAVLHTALCVVPIGVLTDWTVVNRPVTIGFTQLLVNRGVAAWTEYLLMAAVLQLWYVTTRARQRDQLAAQLRAQVTEAELRALRLQLEPHFLFNTLNAVHAHVRDEPEVAESMLRQLSAVLRSVLDAAERPERALREELALARAWLRIHEVRFGSRLQVHVQSDTETDAALVPTLLLQPLVENAIAHGVSQRPGPAAVRIRATRTPDAVVVEIEDSGAAAAADAHAGHRIGLANTRQRLAQRYGALAALELERTPTTTTVRVRWPYAPTDGDGAGDATALVGAS